MTQRSVLTASIVAIIATLLLPATAAAVPDLSGKSPLYVSTYRASYVTCLEKSVGRKDAVAYCEAQAVLAAQAAEAKRALVTAPAGSVQTSTSTGPISNVVVPIPPPTDGMREVQQDIQKYADYDFVIRTPVKITNFRKHAGKTIEESQPLVFCTFVQEGGSFGISEKKALSKTLAEGDSHEEVVVFTIKKGAGWSEAEQRIYAYCELGSEGGSLCADSAYDREKSFCQVHYRSDRNEYTQYF